MPGYCLFMLMPAYFVTWLIHLACRHSPLHPDRCAYELLTAWDEYCLLNEGIEPEQASVLDLAHVLAPVGQSCHG